MRWTSWSEKAKKPTTQMVAGLMGIGLCMVMDCTNVIMHMTVALFTAGVIGWTDQHKPRSNQ